MITSRGSKRDRFQKKRSDDFVGRDEPIAIFKRHLDAKPGEDGFYDIFNIFGQGGVGKSYLVEKIRTLSREKGILTSYTDEGIRNTLEFMNSVTEQLEKQNVSLKRFSERYKKFLQEKQKLDADPEAPKGVLSLLTNTIVKGGLTITEDIPVAGGLVKMIDKDAWASKAGELAEYIKKRWSNADEVQLLIEPSKVLTSLFLEDLKEIDDKKDLIFFIDTYEETSIFLDEWLRESLNDAPDNLVLVISGRDDLNPDDWVSFNDFKCRISLESFTEEEALQFLNKKNIQNSAVVKTILELSFRLPILMAMLADEAPNSPERMTDFSQTAVDRFLKWITDPVQRQLALHAALPRQLNKDIIKQLLTNPTEASLQFDLLTKRPFVQHRGGIWAYHPVVRNLMLKYLQHSSPAEWRTLHIKLADFYHQNTELLSIEKRENQFNSEKWQEFILEKNYHNLLVNFDQNLPESIRNFVTAFRLNGYEKTLPWIEIIGDCGEINNSREWGNLLITGINNLRSQNWEAALEMMSRINDSQLLIDQDDLSFQYLFAGFLNADSSKYTRAIECYQKSIDIKPDNYSAWYNMGIAYSQQENHEKAIECYQKSIDINPDNDSAWCNMGIAYGQQENYEKAIEYLQKAIDIKPDNDSAWYLIGAVYLHKEKNHEKAIEYLQKAIDINPDNDSAWYNMGLAYGQQENHEKEIECFQKSIDIKPDNDSAWYSMGVAYGQQKNYEKAIECFQKAIDINPDKDEAWYIMGATHGQQENYEKAIECFQKAIDIKPDKDEAWYIMGATYGQQENYEKAIECLQKAIDIKPDKDSAWYSMGWVLLKLGKLEEAVNALLTAWEHSKHTLKRAPMNLGHAFLLQRNQKNAIEWYQASLLLWNNQEAFFQEMKSDFSVLAMEKYGFSQQDFNSILESLKRSTE